MCTKRDTGRGEGEGGGGRGKRKLLEEKKKRVPLRFTVGEIVLRVPVAEQTSPHDLDDNARDGDCFCYFAERGGGMNSYVNSEESDLLLLGNETARQCWSKPS